MRTGRIDWVKLILDRFLWAVIILIAIFFAWRAHGFVTAVNLVNLLLHASVLGLLVIGQSICLLSGNFDLSIEGNIQLVAVLAAWMMVPAFGVGGGGGWTLSPFLVIPMVLVLGGIVGMFNGLMVTRLRMNNFIVTLSMQLVLGGIAFLISRGYYIYNIPVPFAWLGSHSFGPVPVQIIFTALAFIAFHLFLAYSRFGRQLYAVGGNREAARASGIDPKIVISKAYILNGVIVAVAAWMLLGRVGQATTKIGLGMTLETFAAAVIGGIALSGGYGSVGGAFSGVLLLSVIDNGLNLMSVNAYWVQGIRGFIILLALFIEAQKFRYKPRVSIGQVTRTRQATTY
jgi:ribose/xylose/arabinose/galactoside ABC-type transport system permease subunit